MSSTLMRLMEVMRERYQGMSFAQQPGDYCGSIQPQNIVIWKSALSTKDGEATLPHVETPGLVITPPKFVRAPAEAGTNRTDDVFYAVMVQLIDTDGQERFEGLGSYTKWLQQIRRASHARSWPEVEHDVYGDVRQSFAESTSVMDEKSWKRHPKFVAGVAVLFTVREPRGIET